MKFITALFLVVLSTFVFAQQRNEVSGYALGNFNPAYFAVQSGQEFAGSTAAGIGWGADYTRTLTKHNAISILYGQNPSDAQLFTGNNQFYTWTLKRYEISVQAIQQFHHKRYGAFIFEGPGAIVTNGGSTLSGWTGNFAFVSGFGFEYQFNKHFYSKSRVSFEDSNTGCYADKACFHSTWSVAQDLWSGIAFKW